MGPEKSLPERTRVSRRERLQRSGSAAPERPESPRTIRTTRPVRFSQKIPAQVVQLDPFQLARLSRGSLSCDRKRRSASRSPASRPSPASSAAATNEVRMSRMRETNLRSKAAIAEGGRGDECVCGEWKERRLGKEEEGKNERAAGDDDENDARLWSRHSAWKGEIIRH